MSELVHISRDKSLPLYSHHCLCGIVTVHILFRLHLGALWIHILAGMSFQAGWAQNHQSKASQHNRRQLSMIECTCTQCVPAYLNCVKYIVCSPYHLKSLLCGTLSCAHTHYLPSQAVYGGWKSEYAGGERRDGKREGGREGGKEGDMGKWRKKDGEWKRSSVIQEHYNLNCMYPYTDSKNASRNVHKQSRTKTTELPWMWCNPHAVLPNTHTKNVCTLYNRACSTCTFTTAEKSSRKLKSPYMKRGSASAEWRPRVSERQVNVNSRAFRRYEEYTEGDWGWGEGRWGEMWWSLRVCEGVKWDIWACSDVWRR